MRTYGLLAVLLFSALCSNAASAERGALPTTLEQTASARAALEKLVRDYEAGDIVALREALDPSMIGYQTFLDGTQRDAAALQQVRIHLFESQITTGPDLAQIDVAWEKRFVSARAAQPGLVSGRMLVLMHRTTRGWRLSAIAGDNALSGQNGALARVAISAMGISRTAIAACSLPCNLPIPIEVVDADLTQARSISVELRTDRGDIEVVTLPAVSPGRFARTGIVFQASTMPMARSGAIEVAPSSAAIMLTVRYLDQNPGAGRPPTTVAHAARIGS